MTNLWRLTVPTLGLVAVLGVPTRASAELVRLSSGRAITVDSVRFDGQDAVLTMKEGGEIRTRRSNVIEVLPDEIPEPTPDERVVLPVAPAPASLSEDEILALVDVLAARAGVDAALAHALIFVESRYKTNAVSPKGAMGLMQLMPATAAQYGLTEPFDPEKNLETGLRHLRGLLDRYDVSRALAAYNAGEGAVARYGGIPPYRETQNYVKKILGLLRKS